MSFSRLIGDCPFYLEPISSGQTVPFRLGAGFCPGFIRFYGTLARSDASRFAGVGSLESLRGLASGFRYSESRMCPGITSAP